jgi:hypothetical protein
LVPFVFKNGLNLNARYKGIPKLSLRTDHNFSFWRDLDYRIFLVPNVVNPGLESKAGDDLFAMADHWLLWNGFGASYALNSRFTLSAYLHNLRRTDTTGDYLAARNLFSLEPKLTWKPSEKLELFIAFKWELYTETMSEDLNKQLNKFISGAAPKETIDTTSTIKIPLGMIMKF